MAGATSRADTTSAAQDVLVWRVARLLDAGFERGVAERLACDRRYDLHALLELVDRGCPPRLAARILTPLEEGVSLC